MHTEINKYEDKMAYYKDILNLRPDACVGRKERE